MSAEQNKEVVRQFFEDFCTGRQLDLADKILAPDHVYLDPQIPRTVGPQAMAELVGGIQSSLEGHWTIEELRAVDDDRVVCRWTGTGRHVGEFAGVPATGKPVRVDAISLLYISKGKIVENRTVWDTLGLMQQIGVVPSPEAANA